MAFSLWALYFLAKEGEGSHLPLKPIKKLITSGPYRYTRNPLVFGLILYYGGLTIWIGSFYALAIFSIFLTLFILYRRNIKEDLLEEKFGEKYLKYKNYTPFLIPKGLLKRNQNKIDSGFQDGKQN